VRDDHPWLTQLTLPSTPVVALFLLHVAIPSPYL
jgi:hypothetical protein